MTSLTGSVLGASTMRPRPPTRPKFFRNSQKCSQSLAFLEPPEIRKAPELVEQHRRYHAEPRQDEGSEPVVPSRDDADRRRELDDDGGHQHGGLERDAGRPASSPSSS